MSEQHEVKPFDVPEGAKYDDYPIREAGYNRDMDRIYVVYEGDDLPDGWDQLIFLAEWNDGSPIVHHIPPGMVKLDDAEEMDTPGAKESKKVYDLLRENGVSFEKVD